MEGDRTPDGPSSHGDVGRPTALKIETTNPPSDAELNLRVFNCLARYVSSHFGTKVLADVTARAGLSPADLDGRTRWASVAQVEVFLAAVRAMLPSEEAFQDACSYQFRESLGVIKFLMGMMSPMRGFERGCELFPMVSQISRFEFERKSRNRLLLRYSTQRPESRLLCLSRASGIMMHPTLWGLPPARVRELSCVALGNDCCTFDIQIYERRRLIPAVVGGALGIAALAVLTVLGIAGPAAWFSVPLAGGLLGYTYELYRTLRANLRVGEESTDMMRDLAREEAQARREIVELNNRQREWTRLMEEQVAERTASLQELASRVRAFRERMRTIIRGFGHDLRIPLHVLRMEGALLRGDAETLSPDGRDLVEDHEEAIKRMDQLLADLMGVATSDTALVTLDPQPVDVGLLVDRLRRRVRALAYGKDLDVSVFSTREAPSTVHVDTMVFDRVFDNLATNAVKYTERGRIIVEVTGTPGFLTLTVSDTGRGIKPESIEGIFKPGGSDAANRAPNSYGVGLSVVVQLLAQCGGRLEVVSKPGVGTTFWVHFPVAAETQDTRSSANDGPVLTIRKDRPLST